MNRDQLIASMQKTVEDNKPRKVPGGAYGGDVFVKSLTVAEVDMQSDDVKADDKKALARQACKVICDENGTRLLDYQNDDDVTLVAEQPWAVLRHILAEAGKVSGQTDAGVEDAKKD